MKKVVLGLLALVLLGALSWALFFRNHENGLTLREMITSIIAREVEEDRVEVQSLGGSELSLSTQSFLKNISRQAERQPIELPFIYSNNGVSVQRTVFVSVPEGFTSENNTKTYPVCFIFHGTARSGNGAAHKSSRDDMDSGCITIAPVGGITDDGMYSWNANGSTDEDDLVFVQSLWDVTKGDVRVDTSRVYAYGHSVGSLFVSNVLAVSADFFAGLCCYSSQLMTSTNISNAPCPRNIVYLHGEDDPMIPSDGGPARFDDDLIFLSISDTVSAWAQHNGCQGEIVTEENESYTRYYPKSCRDSVVDSYIFKGVAHNSVGPVTEFFGVSAAALALQLFEAV